MSRRYLAVAWPDDPRLAVRARDTAGEAARAAGLVEVFAGAQLAVFAERDDKTLAIGAGRGVVLGTLFDRSAGTDAIARLGAGVSDRIVESRGQSLVDGFWGGYVAFVGEDRAGATHVLRDPSGAFPCFYVERDGLTCFFSDLDLAAEAGWVKGHIDWSFVAHHLSRPGLRAARTGLGGVRELLAGTRLSLGRTAAQAIDCCWSPWAFVAAEGPRGGPEAAVERLRAETRRCVGAWAAQAGPMLLQLSGGLDSSIVAACLGETQASVHCLTLATPDPGADERAYAQAVADRIAARLTIARLDPAQGDLTAAWPARLARPGLNVLQRCVDRLVFDQACQLGADTIVTGAGGDSVFCYLDTAAPAADALRVSGPGAAFARAADDLATLHQCTVWRAAGLAVKKAWTPAPKAWRHDVSFLSPDAWSTPQQDHPWLPAPAGALPGKWEQVTSLMGLQSTPDGHRQTARGSLNHPLLSQPLVELCLGIPSWMWMTGGRNRALARDAFAGALPPLILNRRTKGDFSAFNAAIFERQRAVLRDRLLGGALSAKGLLDRPAIERFLQAPLQPRSNAFFRLFVLADMETWIETWSPGRSSTRGRA